MKKLIKLILKCFGLVLLGLLLLTVFSAWQVYDFARRKQPENIKADAVVVLGAAAWGKQPSPVFRERINHAMTLYQQNRVDKLIFTGGSPKDGYLTEAEVAKRYAMRKFNIPEQAILLDTESDSTYANLLNTRSLMRQHGIDNIIIVSDPEHLARAAAMAAHLEIEATVAATPSSLYYKNQRQRWKFGLQEVFSLVAFRLTAWFQAA